MPPFFLSRVTRLPSVGIGRTSNIKISSRNLPAKKEKWEFALRLFHTLGTDRIASDHIFHFPATTPSPPRCAPTTCPSSRNQPNPPPEKSSHRSTPRQLSAVSKVLAGGQERGLLEGDLRAIMSIMGPSDLSDLEDEVKVIQQNVRAWILRCNYKSLRKAAKTLQVWC